MEHKKNMIYSLQGKQKNPRYAKIYVDDKKQILINKTRDIQDTINTNFAINEDITELMNILEKVQKNPNNYINEKPKYHIRKRPIRDYLKSLNLKDKGDEITNFMSSIK